MTQAGFEPTMPASERLQTHALDRTATGIGQVVSTCEYKKCPQKDPLLLATPRKCREKSETIKYVSSACLADSRIGHKMWFVKGKTNIYYKCEPHCVRECPL